MKLNGQERTALRKMLFMRKLHYSSFFLAMPAAVIAPILAGKARTWLGFSILAAFVALFGYTFHWLKRFKCPRCERPYFVQQGPLPNMGTALPLQKWCQGCGLRIDNAKNH